MDSTVKQMLAAKDLKELWTLKPDDTVLYALEYMAEKNVGALPVMEDEILIGIFSERDYARIFPLQKDSPESTPVSEVMTEKVYCIGPENTACDCMGLMTEKRIRHIPVLDGEGNMTGIITIGDVLKQVIKDQENLIGHLEFYISGKA
jgi:CBS domain-containing protein